MKIFEKLETLAYKNIIVPLQGRTTFDFVHKHYSEGMKVLDFGCGTGSNSKLFNPKDYIGSEVNSSRVESSGKNYPKYKEIFSNLILQTRSNFPKSEILIIQQQIPGCNFVSKNIVYDRHPNQGRNYCLDLLKVFKLQEKISEVLKHQFVKCENLIDL